MENKIEELNRQVKTMETDIFLIMRKYFNLLIEKKKEEAKQKYFETGRIPILNEGFIEDARTDLTNFLKSIELI